MCLTEPQARQRPRRQCAPGPSRSAMAATRMHGQKIYITWGEHETAPANIAAPGPGAAAGCAAGLARASSLFAAHARCRTTARATRCAAAASSSKMGIHASPTCVMLFEGAEAELVGEPHRGLHGDVRHDERRAARRRRAGRGAGRRARCALAEAYAAQRVQGGRADRRAPRRGAHAGRDARHHAGRAAAGAGGRRGARPPRSCWGTRRRGDAARAADADREGLVHRSRRRTSPRSASRCMAAWASSRTPAPPRCCAMPASRRSTRAPTASRRSTCWSASWRKDGGAAMRGLLAEMRAPPTRASRAAADGAGARHATAMLARRAATPTPAQSLAVAYLEAAAGRWAAGCSPAPRPRLPAALRPGRDFYLARLLPRAAARVRRRSRRPSCWRCIPSCQAASA